MRKPIFERANVLVLITGILAVIFFAVSTQASDESINTSVSESGPVQLASNTAAVNPESSKEKLSAYQLLLKDAMDKAFAVIESIQKDNTLGSEEKAQKIIEFLRVVRYGPERKDYFSIMDRQGKVIMDPYQPDMVGKNLASFTDMNGKKIVQDIMKVINEKGEGFVDCLWPEYEGKIPVPKVVFVRAFNPIVTTGVYLNTIEPYEIETELFIRGEPFVDDNRGASPQ